MQSGSKFIHVGISVVVWCLLVPHGAIALPTPAECSDVAARGYVNVLTLNLLFFSPVEPLHIRLQRVAEYMKVQAERGEPLDIILLQEVTGGILSESEALNSGLALQHLLQNQGVSYNLRYRLETGLPLLLTVGNAILSRCKVLATLSTALPLAREDLLFFAGVEVPLRRIVMMSQLAVPGYGNIHVYNTHLCAVCAIRDLAQQTEAVLTFVADTERSIRGKSPLILLGGDLNLDQQLHAHQAIYTRIIHASFTDTYATRHGCTTCCSPAEGFAGCTYGAPVNRFVALNPFVVDPEPARIDYLFVRTTGHGAVVRRSAVVFKGTHLDDARWVSDHTGVLSRIRLGE